MKKQPKSVKGITHAELQRVADLQAAAWNMHVEALDAFASLRARQISGEPILSDELYIDAELRMVRSRKQINRWGVVEGGRRHG